MSIRSAMSLACLLSTALAPGSVAAAPDLHIKTFAAKATDRTVTYTAQVCNQGTTTSQKFTMEIFYHQASAPGCAASHSDRVTYNGLAAGACNSYTFTRYNAPTGSYTAWALADGDCAVSEADEGNNTTSSSYTVGKPDLVINSLSASVADRTVTYTAQVCNNGSSALTQFYVEIFYNSSTAPGCATAHSDRVTYNGLGAGNCLDYTFTRYNVPLGKQMAWAMADGDCAVTEHDEGNNTASSSHEVMKPDLSISALTNLEVDAPAGVTVNSPMSRFSGVVQADTVITNAVISTSYTPGAGNVW